MHNAAFAGARPGLALRSPAGAARAVRGDREGAARLGLPRGERDDPAQARRAGAGRRAHPRGAGDRRREHAQLRAAGRSRPTTPTRRASWRRWTPTRRECGRWCWAPAARGRAVAWALREAGAADVARLEPHARTGGRAGGGAGRAARGAPGPCDLLVNATSVGLEPALEGDEALAALGLESLDPPPLVVDLVYSSAPSAAARMGRTGRVRRRWTAWRCWCARGRSASSAGPGREAPLDAMRRPRALRS